jgi:CRISPR-associated protein Cmr4
VTTNLVYLYLLAPLHTGGTTQEGNLLGIARESHTELPYIPSSTIRGRLRASTDDSIRDGKGDSIRSQLFGKELSEGVSLTQGSIWIGDGSILWMPVPSLSHGVVWVSCPMLLKRWARLTGTTEELPTEKYINNFADKKSVYLKDAIIRSDDIQPNTNLTAWIPLSSDINRALILPDQHYATLVQMSLWRQVKVKLDQNKMVDGGFRYEEAIPPDTLMYFPWGITSQANTSQSLSAFEALVKKEKIIQLGGQESLGRGFVQLSSNHEEK